MAECLDPSPLPPIRTTVATNTQLQLYCMKVGRPQSIYLLLHGSYKHTATTVLYEGWTTPVHLPPIRTMVAIIQTHSYNCTV